MTISGPVFLGPICLIISDRRCFVTVSIGATDSS